MRILAFYHILLINHWREIVEEQLNILLSCGLYDVAERVYVGCLGEKKEQEKLIDIFKPHGKIEVAYCSENKGEFEFATLKLLKEKADNDSPFYGLYYHGKAVSWPRERRMTAYIGGTYWRAYMNYWNLIRWKDCIKKLDEGHDVCGVKLLQPKDSPAKRLHYSGSFFWGKSEYIKKLPSIESLNQADRFQAEFWSCSANPKAATLCQDFIDYTAKGKFKPPIR